MQVEQWGVADSGASVERVTLAHDERLVAKITNLGATLTELWAPDRTGRAGNIVLGLDRIDGYLSAHPYLGATMGRVANRIAQARFSLDGVEYRLGANEGTAQLHGGVNGFHRRVFDLTPVGENAVDMHLRSPAGEEGYPGNLDVDVRYTLTEDGLHIDYQATTDAPTPINLTNHSYFNLGGAGTILDHVLEIPADHYTPTDDRLIPTGEIAPVAGTGLDFTSPTRIGDRIEEFIGHANGYDHNFVLADGHGALTLAARVSEPVSGRVVEVWTTEPGMQLYTGNWLDGTISGVGGILYPRYGGLCLETQHFPDSVNHPSFPSTIVRPGETFRSTTVFRLAVEAGRPATSRP